MSPVEAVSYAIDGDSDGNADDKRASTVTQPRRAGHHERG
jgi:hypothetical protein